MNEERHYLSVDASSDTGVSKMNPSTITLFDVNRQVVSQKWLDLCLTTGVDASKPKEVFDAIDNTLERYEIPWYHCVAFGIDSTNSNIGAKHSIKSRVTQVNPSIYFVSCPHHIIHNAVQKAAENFRDVCGIDIEECCVDYYYWFHKGTK